jgi:hypothetical protein
MQMTKSKWVLPAFSVAAGGVLFGAQWIGGDPSGGLVSLAIMTAMAAVLLFGGRSETIRGLRGDGRDERFARIDIHATALAGLAVITAVIVGFVIALARGQSGARYDSLGAIGGLTYVVAIVILRLRGEMIDFAVGLEGEVSEGA